MKFIILFAVVGLSITACNDSTKNTDTTTSDSASVNSNAVPDNAAGADTETTEFLVKAADGGMAEVTAGEMAKTKAANESVKMFADMMVGDHTGANQQVKDLAAKLQVTLPAAPSEEHQKNIAKAGEKSGANFDKAYMDMMVADHEKTISLFKDASGKVGNQEVKSFIDNSIPKLQMHLDSATAIKKRL